MSSDLRRAESDGQGLPARTDQWLPKPPDDPNFLRRVARLRWEKAAALVVIAAVWSVFLWVLTLKHTSGLSTVWQFLAPGSFYFWMRVRSRRASPYLADLLDLPSVCPQFPAEIVYRAGSTFTGSDEGIVSFVDGWLHFQGRRTRWAVRSSDVQVDPHSKPKSQQDFYFRQGLLNRIRWKRDQQSYCIELLPLDAIEGLSKGLRSDFQQMLASWSAEQMELSEESVWPPTVPVPGLETRLAKSVRTWTFVAALPAGWLLIALVGTRFGATLPFWTYLVAIGAVLSGLVGSLSDASQLWTVHRLNPSPEVPEIRVPNRPWWSTYGRARDERKVRRRLQPYTSRLRNLLDPLETHRQFPVEAHYCVGAHVFRDDLGIVTVGTGWIEFRGQDTSWVLTTQDVSHIDPSGRAWSAQDHFKQILLWQADGIAKSIDLLPLDRFEGLGDHLGAHLAAALEGWGDKPPAEIPSIWPTSTVKEREVKRLESEFISLSGLKIVAHALWLSGVAMAISNLVGLWQIGIAALIGGLAALITGEYRRGKIANQLEAIRYMCEGGSMVTFRRGQGPRWKRINQPWVK